MTLAAKINEEIYLATKINDKFGKENIAKCIGCNGILIYHRNVIGKKIQHWAHKIPCCFETEPESQEHLKLKELIYNSISDKYKKYIPDSIYIQNQKPDIYIEDKITNQKIAIEIQCSSISYESFIQRTQGYANKGIYVFWVFGDKWFKKKLYTNTKENIIEKRITEVERKLHQLNYGRVYFVELKNDSYFISSIHFGTIVREKDYCENCWWEENIDNWDGDCSRCWVSAQGLDGGVVKNVLKSTKQMVDDNEGYFTSNLEFILFENNGYKLARLNDPHFWRDN